MSLQASGCALCEAPGGALVVRQERWRIIRAQEVGFPAFYRVVWNAHVREFSDLNAEHRQECMEVVVGVEQALRRHLAPTKINLATLGNMVAHVHWHVIARFDWDSHFPGPVWAPAVRAVNEERVAEVASALARVDEALSADLG